METIADILLVAGALGAGVYCFVLARRLSRFNDLQSGIGGAVAVLSAQVDDLTRTLTAAQTAAKESTSTLDELTQRSETVAGRLEILMASMHDMSEDPKQTMPPKKQHEASIRQDKPMFTRHGPIDRSRTS
jgi:ABC-type transporter Mla subunit MlaD